MYNNIEKKLDETKTKLENIIIEFTGTLAEQNYCQYVKKEVDNLYLEMEKEREIYHVENFHRTSCNDEYEMELDRIYDSYIQQCNYLLYQAELRQVCDENYYKLEAYI